MEISVVEEQYKEADKLLRTFYKSFVKDDVETVNENKQKLIEHLNEIPIILTHQSSPFRKRARTEGGSRLRRQKKNRTRRRK
jgi:hypothetical protein